MSYKKILLAAFLFFLFSLPVFSQSADWIESLLAQGSVTYADAALLVLDAAGAIEAGVDADAAFRFAAEMGWLPKRAEAGGGARLDGLCLLVMRAFDIPGGLFYTLTKSARHAYREMVYLGLIQGSADPHMPVSGSLLLFTVNRTLELLGG